MKRRINVRDVDYVVNVDKKLVGKYKNWDIFLDIKDRKVFIATCSLFSRSIKGSNIRELMKNINNKEAMTDRFIKTCKAVSKDSKKCDLCEFRFICFAEAGKS